MLEKLRPDVPSVSPTTKVRFMNVKRSTGAYAWIHSYGRNDWINCMSCQRLQAAFVRYSSGFFFYFHFANGRIPWFQCTKCTKTTATVSCRQCRNANCLLARFPFEYKNVCSKAICYPFLQGLHCFLLLSGQIYQQSTTFWSEKSVVWATFYSFAENERDKNETECRNESEDCIRVLIVSVLNNVIKVTRPWDK